MTTHATLSASTAHRWLACPGSIRESAGVTASASEYAELGTATHELIEWCLKETRSKAASYKIGKTVNTVDSKTGKHFIVTEEMAENAQVYIDLVTAEFAASTHATLYIENKFNLDWLRPGMFGTNDAMIVQKFGKMIVFDYKNGSGVMVDAEENEQLMYYGLGALGEGNLHCVEEVELVIVQPNGQGEKVKRWSTTPEALYAWSRDVLLPGAVATDAPDAPLHPGECCRFCPAKVHCPALRRLALESAGQAFDVIPSVGDVVLVAPSQLSNEQLGKLLAVTDVLSTWFGNVREAVHAKLTRGELVPGWKLVAGRSSRKWTNEEAAAKALLPVYGEAVFDPKALRSVAQMEKMFKQQKIDAETALNGLVETSRAVQIAPEGDKRQALNGIGGEAFNDQVPEELR